MPTQLLLTYDFPPLGGGIARWMGELAKRYPAGSLVVSTGRHPGSEAVDSHLPNRVDRVPVASERLRSIQGLAVWCRRARSLASSWDTEFTWCGNLKPAGYPAGWLKARLGVPFGILVHGGDLLILRRQAGGSVVKRRIARTLLRQASVVVANSNWTRDLCYSLLNELRIPSAPDTVRTVPLGADPILFRPGISQAAVRSHYRLDGRRWLLSVARLTRHKGIDTGLRVLAALGDRYPDLGYAVVGSGAERNGLEALCRQLRLGDRVRFLGDVPDHDLAALYNSAEIYLGLSRLLPDRVEGFGISLAEAAACGIPVIAARTGGIPEAVRDRETGLLVNPDDPHEIAQAVGCLLDDSEQASRMGRAGRRMVETYYNWDRVTGDLVRIGHELGKPAKREAVLSP